MKEQYSTPVKQSKHTYFSRLLSLDLGGKNTEMRMLLKCVMGLA